MSNGKAVVEGIVYLADKFTGGDKNGIQVAVSEYDYKVLELSLAEDKEMLFADADVEFMKTLGFDYQGCQGEYWEEDSYEDAPYSCFYIDA